MVDERKLSAAERRTMIDQRLDEIDRTLLGLLPRTERLAIVANVEARVRELGDDVLLTREAPVDSPAAALSPAGSRARPHRSRLAFTAGVLGIIAFACLIFSPLFLVGMTLFAELLGESLSIILFALIVSLVATAGAIAVFGGGASLFRLGRRGQTTTGTGWAVTGLCTGLLPMLIGFVGLLAALAEVLPSETVEVTWSASPSGPVPYQGVSQPPMMYPPTAMVPPPYGVPASPPLPMPMTSNMPSLPIPMPMLPAAPPAPQQKAMPVVEPAAESTAKPAAISKEEPAAKPAAEPLPLEPLEEPSELED